MPARRSAARAGRSASWAAIASRAASEIPHAGCLGLAAWTGLVIGFKLVTLSIRRKRTDYQPDRSRCVSCGRCYWYCPGEQVRLGLIRDVSEVVKD